jgi:hypothetical protein
MYSRILLRIRPTSIPSSIKHQFPRSLLTQAYAQGPTSPPLLNQTIGEHFAGIVREHGDRTAYGTLRVANSNSNSNVYFVFAANMCCCVKGCVQAPKSSFEL